MAQYDHFPIFRAALRLSIHLEMVVCGFSRYTTYTLGSEMRSQVHEILRLIIWATSERDNSIGCVHQGKDIYGGAC